MRKWVSLVCLDACNEDHVKKSATICFYACVKIYMMPDLGGGVVSPLCEGQGMIFNKELAYYVWDELAHCQ